MSLTELLPFIASIVSLATALTVAGIGTQNSRLLDKDRRSHEFSRYNIEQIQISIDEILKSRESRLLEITEFNHNEKVAYFYDYADQIDYFWERVKEYCLSITNEEIHYIKERKKKWMELANAIKNNPKSTYSQWKEYVRTCLEYKKALFRS